MRFRCPSCGSLSCVTSAEHVLEIAPTMYAKCQACHDLVLKKTDEINLSDINFNDLTCTNCGRRPLDAVMAHILATSVRRKDRPKLSLREVGTVYHRCCHQASLHTLRHILDTTTCFSMTNQRLIADASDRILRRGT